MGWFKRRNYNRWGDWVEVQVEDCTREEAVEIFHQEIKESERRPWYED